MNIRIGFGFDVHGLGEGHRLIIGGTEIPWHKGCIGHSDGDVLIHAICDAMFGASGTGDIGIHFPDNSPEFKGIDSKIILQKTVKIIQSAGYCLLQVDSTVCLEQPKISKYIPEMISTLSEILGIDPSNISIKAKTSEKLGFVGREEGVTAYAVVLLEKIN